MKTVSLIFFLFTSVFCAAQAHNDTYQEGVEYNLDAFYTEPCTQSYNTLMVDPIFTNWGMMDSDSVMWLYTAEYSSDEYGYCTDTLLTTNHYYTFDLPFTNISTEGTGSVVVQAFRGKDYIGTGTWWMPFCKNANKYADVK